MIKAQVLIIGAGPSGLVSALCLAKHGIASTIVERSNSVSTHPKAHELNARSIEILSQLDITDEDLAFEAAPFTDGSRIMFCNSIQEEFGRIDLFDDPDRRKKYEEHLQSDAPYLNISQSALEQIVLEKVHANELITIRFGHQWKSLKEVEDLVISEIIDCGSGQAYHIDSKYVIAADGAGSRCRKFLGIKMIGESQMQEFVSAYFENDLRHLIKIPAKLFWIFNPHAPGTFIAHHIEKRWVYMVPIFPKYQSKELFTKDYLETKIKTALGDQSVDIKVKSISFWNMSAQLAETYLKGRVLLVGDAAHRFPPTGGLGMNTGIADAHNIGWKLAAVLKGQASISLLDSYEIERKPIAAQNTEESVYNYHKILEVPEAFGLDRDGLEKLVRVKHTPPLKWLPNSWVRSMEHFILSFFEKKLKRFYHDQELQEEIKRTIADQIAHFDRIGLDIGYVYDDGAMIKNETTAKFPSDRVTQYVPNVVPGARLPHMTLNGKNGTMSTHDLLEYDQFTLLQSAKTDLLVSRYNTDTHSSLPKVKSVKLEELGLAEESTTKLFDLLDIGDSGAILVRPDGHIAWKMMTSVSEPPNQLQEILEEILNIKTDLNE